jgi:predicted DNA-binding transcriptional regulator YafY
VSSASANYASGLRLARIMLGLMQRPLGWSYDAIGDTLGVGQRTVQRYARTLTTELVDEVGEPLVERFSRGDQPALRLRADVGPVQVGLYQYAAILAALRYLPSAHGTVVGEGIGDVLERMGREPGLARFSSVTSSLGLSFHHATRGAKSYTDRDELLDDVFLALVQRHPIELEYQRPKGRSFGCRFLPYTLVLYDDGLYLHGDATYEDGSGPARRLLAVERIRVARVQRGEQFRHPDGYDPGKEFAGRLGVWGGKAEKIVLRFAPSVAYLVQERSWPGEASIAEQADGSLVLTMTVAATPELRSFVLSYGDQVEVEQPDGLRQEIVGIVERMQATYGQGSRGDAE